MLQVQAQNLQVENVSSFNSYSLLKTDHVISTTRPRHLFSDYLTFS